MAKHKRLPGFLGKIQDGYIRMRNFMDPVDEVLANIGRTLYSMRKFIMTLPVVLLALEVYEYAMEKMPQEVGFWLQENGTFRYILDKPTAITVCAAITGACLVLMFLSRRIIYPWIITIFTLVLPIFLVISNLIPL